MKDKTTKLYLAAGMRGFLKHLLKIESKKIKFIINGDEKNSFYEVSSKKKLILKKLAVSRIANLLGVIQVNNINKIEEDIIISYNRFVNTKKPYIIILENPTALYHYCLEKNKTVLGRYRIRKMLGSKSLKAIVCISKACFETLEEVLAPLPVGVRREQIYPLIPRNPKIDIITNKLKEGRIKCLYISANFELKSGVEIVEVFERLYNDKIEDISLEIITKLDKVDSDIKKKIARIPTIKLLDFTLSSEELSKKYIESDILLHLTRQDSLPLTVLEAIKGGMMVIATDVYAIPELVQNNYNGFLTTPKYMFFDERKIPNPSVWNNREKTIYSKYIDEKIVRFVYTKLIFLRKNKEKILKMCNNSIKIGCNSELGEKDIVIKWEKLIDEIVEGD